ncbi:hypothetical protein J437_LFUL006650 [Ladona fulva]|uniref:ZSWIM1/3 RNaseH-like domain-containing protein n=1 Tax=Ladona fulva TaxID=123851 RepID=A0A8K0NWF6_LADFU|nr:hypothetical protein J437_LFUL006650 [Ladona fulva]
MKAKGFGFRSLPNCSLCRSAKVKKKQKKIVTSAFEETAGANDHPAAVTFLQLYKLLAVYGVLKPPRSGNCSIKDDIPLTPMIKISDIREIYSEKSSSQSNIQKLKEQLDGLIEQGDWEVCDIFCLGIQLPQQLEEMVEGYTQILCIDYTHGTNQYKYHLLNLVIPDEYGIRYPVAHFLTNYIDEGILVWDEG